MVGNTSVRLGIFGGNNVVKCWNSNVVLSIVGSLNYVGWKGCSVEVVNNSGENRFENVGERGEERGVRVGVREGEGSVVGRSNS